MPGYRRLQGFHPQVGLGAAVALAASADEVEVDPAVAPPSHDDEPPAAASAPQRALEVVVVDPLPGPAPAVERKHPLYPVEQVRRYQRRMPAGVLLALVLHDAQVVPIRQDVVELVERQRPRWRLARPASAQACRVDHVHHLAAGVLAGGVQFEAPDDMRCPVRINAGHRHFPPIYVDTLINIARRGFRDRAAVLRFLAHLVADIRSVGLRLVLVDRVNNRLHHRALGDCPMSSTVDTTRTP